MWGSENWTLRKTIVLGIYFLTLAFMFYGLIGLSSDSRNFLQLVFYLCFLFFLGIAPLGIDMLVTKKEEPIDTVSDEAEDDGGGEGIVQLSIRNIFLLSLGLGILFAIFISVSQTAFVQAPTFQMFETKFGQALLSGIVGGICETAVIFGFLTPTFVGFFERFASDNKILSSLVGIIGGALIFFLYHTIVYQYDQIALLSVFIFGFINSLLLFVFRSVYPLIAIHFVNNFMIVFASVSTFAVFL